MKITRRTILFAFLLLFAACAGLSVLSVLLAPDGVEPVAEIAAPAAAATQVEPTATDAETEVAERLSPTTQATTVTATRRPTRTVAPTDRPSPFPTDTRPPATAATVPTATLRPTLTASTPPTASPAPTALPPTAGPTLPPSPAPTATTAASSGQETATVTNIVDGDTIDVSLNGAIYRVRYIGINTPESGETCGSEATAANAALVAGRTVTMVRDVSETDRYGRLLRYVYVGSTFVNGELVAGGWADAVDYPPDTAQSGTLHSLMASGAGRGCDLVAAPLPTQPVRAPEATVPLEPAPTSPPSGNCHPSYPGVCIPPPPPDLDCGDIPYRRFQVVGDDPHRFDGDGNGIGCESG